MGQVLIEASAGRHKLRLAVATAGVAAAYAAFALFIPWDLTQRILKSEVAPFMNLLQAMKQKRGALRTDV